MGSYFYLFLAISFTTLGQLSYKVFSLTSIRKYYYLSIVLFLLTPIASFMALRNLAIDIVYVSTALTIFAVTVLSRFLLKEKIQGRNYVGVFLILLGVILYGL